MREAASWLIPIGFALLVVGGIMLLSKWEGKRKPKVLVRVHLVGSDDSVEGEYAFETRTKLVLYNAFLLQTQQQRREVGTVWLRWEKIYFLQEIEREFTP